MMGGIMAPGPPPGPPPASVMHAALQRREQQQPPPQIEAAAQALPPQPALPKKLGTAPRPAFVPTGVRVQRQLPARPRQVSQVRQPIPKQSMPAEEPAPQLNRSSMSVCNAPAVSVAAAPAAPPASDSFDDFMASMKDMGA